MKKLLLVLILIILSSAAYAKQLRIVTAYPYIADITKEITKHKARVTHLARGDFDPHSIIPKPSYIAKLRRADLLIINGAQLEIGWMPPIVKRASNPDIIPGKDGFLDLSNYVKLIDKPQSVSRAQGDIHPDGNPHFYLDPHNIPILARAIMNRIIKLDYANASFYRRNYYTFNRQWKSKLGQWKTRMSKVKGVSVIQYHKNLDYFLKRYSIRMIGTVELLPGIPPTSRHTYKMKNVIRSNNVKFILQDVYNSTSASRYLARSTGAKLIKIPHDVRAVRNTGTIFKLFDELVRRITND